jgi:hypothetical protein
MRALRSVEMVRRGNILALTAPCYLCMGLILLNGRPFFCIIKDVLVSLINTWR